MHQKIYPLLPPSCADDLRYYTEDEFKSRYRLDGQVHFHDGELPEELPADEHDPLDGRLIEMCDKLAAYVEASVSIQNGVRSHALEEGKRGIYRKYRSAALRTAAGGKYPFGLLFDLFW